MDNLYNQAIDIMEQSFEILFKKVPQPQNISTDGTIIFRYKEQTIYQALILKLARVITGLKSIHLLNKAGLVQEQAGLQRVIHDIDEDIGFLCRAIIYNDFTDDHQKYLDYYWQEEFEKQKSALDSKQKRGSLPRPKIHSYLSKNMSTGNVDTFQKEVFRTLQKTYSGFLHGAAPQIMELYYGFPPKFNFQNNDSPFFKSHENDLLNYFYRSILSFEFAAVAFQEDKLKEELKRYSDDFAVSSGQEDHLREPK